MNPMMEEIRAANINHYYQSSRVRAYCCGFISRSSNTTYVCFLWAVKLYDLMCICVKRYTKHVCFV